MWVFYHGKPNDSICSLPTLFIDEDSVVSPKRILSSLKQIRDWSPRDENSFQKKKRPITNPFRWINTVLIDNQNWKRTNRVIWLSMIKDSYCNHFKVKTIFWYELTIQNSFFDLKKWVPVQKIIWNLYFLFVYRILHQKIFQKNQSKGIYRDKKNKQDLLLSHLLITKSSWWALVQIWFWMKNRPKFENYGGENCVGWH